jgi:hypothetical protein
VVQAHPTVPNSIPQFSHLPKRPRWRLTVIPFRPAHIPHDHTRDERLKSRRQGLHAGLRGGLVRTIPTHWRPSRMRFQSPYWTGDISHPMGGLGSERDPAQDSSNLWQIFWEVPHRPPLKLIDCRAEASIARNHTASAAPGPIRSQDLTFVQNHERVQSKARRRQILRCLPRRFQRPHLRESASPQLQAR